MVFRPLCLQLNILLTIKITQRQSYQKINFVGLLKLLFAYQYQAYLTLTYKLRLQAGEHWGGSLILLTLRILVRKQKQNETRNHLFPCR